MVIISKKEFNENYRNHLLFISPLCGGLGNYLGGFFSSIDFYYSHNLNLTHKFVCISNASTTGDIYITDLFDFNDNIILLNNNKEDGSSGLNYPDNIWQPPHPYIHLHTSPPSDIKTKSILFRTNCLSINNFNNLIIGKNYFQMKIQENIEQNIISFVRDKNIDKNTLGMHYRGTDRIVSSDNINHFVEKCKSMSYKKYFICSDEPEAEKYLATKFNGSIYNKNTKVIKNPDFKHCGWTFTNDEKKIASSKFKISSQYNVYRSLQQCIDGFIDAAILGHCKIISNQFSSFDELAECIFKLFFTQ